MKLIPAACLAVKVRDELAPFCERIEIAGSIRRERPEVNDIDLVLIPKSASSMLQIIARCRRTTAHISGIEQSQNLKFRFLSGFDLDLFIAHAGIVDLVSKTPSNWGAVMLCRTGSQFHNTQLCELARGKGLKFAPYKGIVVPAEHGEEIIASETEKEIYEALGLEYRDPRKRETLS